MGRVYLLTVRRWKPLLWFSGAALLMIAPWMILNAIEVGNPVAPLRIASFPIRISTSPPKKCIQNSALLRSISLREIPLEITIEGEQTARHPRPGLSD